MKKIKPLFIILTILILVLLIPIGMHLFTSYKHSSSIKAEFDKLLYKYDSFDDEMPVIDPIDDISQTNVEFINKDDSLKDIDYLFSLLKYGYSGYEYFGGDERFLLAKENIQALITNSDKSIIPIGEFTDIIYEELKFIQDSHFTLGCYKLCDYTKYYSSRKLRFYKDGKDFYTLVDDRPFYLTEIMEGSISDYMKPTLDRDGKQIYNLGILSDTPDISIPINLVLKSDDNTLRNLKISLFEYKPFYKEETESYRYYEIDGIPVLEVNSLCRITPEDGTIESFIKDSKNLKIKDDLIIDLRGNIGGNLINVDQWFKGFTGTRLRKDIIESGLYTNTSISLSKNKFESKVNENDSVKNDCLIEISSHKKKRYFPGWSTIEYGKFKPVKNKTNIVVLLDKNTSSAAEFFAHYLRKIDNVTLVGTNTNGCLLTGNSNPAYLPYSDIALSIPHKLYIHPNFTSIEGIGIQPNLWIKPEQALDRIVKSVKYKR